MLQQEKGFCSQGYKVISPSLYCKSWETDCFFCVHYINRQWRCQAAEKRSSLCARVLLYRVFIQDLIASQTYITAPTQPTGDTQVLSFLPQHISNREHEQRVRVHSHQVIIINKSLRQKQLILRLIGSPCVVVATGR